MYSENQKYLHWPDDDHGFYGYRWCNFLLFLIHIAQLRPVTLANVRFSGWFA